MKLTRVQRRFFAILGKGLGIILGSATVTALIYMAYSFGLGLEHKDAVSASMLTALLGGFLGYGIKAIWDRAVFEIEYETEVVEKALKSK